MSLPYAVMYKLGHMSMLYLHIFCDLLSTVCCQKPSPCCDALQHTVVNKTKFITLLMFLQMKVPLTRDLSLC